MAGEEPGTVRLALDRPVATFPAATCEALELGNGRENLLTPISQRFYFRRFLRFATPRLTPRRCVSV